MDRIWQWAWDRYPSPDDDRQLLGLEPRLASWNKADNPDQVRLQAFLDHTETLLADSSIDGSWALKLDGGLPAVVDQVHTGALLAVEAELPR